MVAQALAAPTSNELLLANGAADFVELISGAGWEPANSADPDYAYGVGRGGLAGASGGDGMAVLLVFVAGQSQPARTFFYAADGAAAFVVPASPVAGAAVEFLVAKLWGAGGGGGGKGGKGAGAIGRGATNASQAASFAVGGGGAFAQVTSLVPVTNK